MPLTSSEAESPQDEYHRRRSDRTRKCLDGWLPNEIHCAVTVSDDWASSPYTRTGAETLCNLLGRFCNQVTAVVPSHQSGFLNGSHLVEILHASDPYGRFVVSNTAPEADLHLRLGADGGPTGRTIYWAFRGWAAFVSGSSAPGLMPIESGIDSAAGAEMAACLAGAAAFRFWVERSVETLAPFSLDLLNLAESSSISELSDAVADTAAARPLNVLMVGAGSVGSASAYFLPRLGFRGHIDVVDEDIVKIENMDRSPIFRLEHAPNRKAEVVSNYLKQQKISSVGHPMMWNQFVADRRELLRKHHVWLPLANEHGVRRAMQANIPPICIQSSTGRNWNVQYGRHIPFVDDCQVDRFPAEPNAPLGCATGDVAAPSGHVEDVALPFASFAAGLLVAAGVQRIAMGRQDIGENAAFLNFKPSFSLLTQPREPNPHCICQEITPRMWEDVWQIRRP